MKSSIECIPCFLRQALDSARLCGLDKNKQREIINAVAVTIPDFSLDDSPVVMAKAVHVHLRSLTGIDDPYREIKKESNRKAMALYPELKARVAAAEEPLLSAVKMSIAGNLIDYGARQRLDLDADLESILKKEEEAIAHEQPGLFQYTRWKQELEELSENTGAKILVLGDNAGEIVFDRILIETLHRLFPEIDIVYAVRGAPIINDVLESDARDVGIDKTAEIVSSGADAPGTLLELCTPSFREFFFTADMVISKGQGNYEAVSEENRRIWMLLTAKCPVMAGEFSAGVGDIILTAAH